MNVRWDAVVKGNALRLARPASRPAPAGHDTGFDAGHDTGPSAAVARSLAVRVFLFGRLGARRQSNPIELELTAPCCLRDVVEALAARLGSGFRRQVLSSTGTPHETCRIALNGALASDLSTRLAGAPQPATIEIIVFREIEGG